MVSYWSRPRAATNKYGAFSAAVPRHLRSFRVTISGGTTNDNPFPAHLVADVVLTAPAHEIPGHRTPAITDLANQFEIVVVNPVTTLVSVVLDRRRDFNIPDREPKLELDDAQVLVRRFLKLPPNYDLGMALRQSSHYKSRFFSPFALVTQAEAAGGLDALVHLLLQELASGSTHSFRQPQLLGSTSSSDPSSILQAGLAAAALDIASAAGVENLAGWALALGGFSTSASSDDIDALVMELQDLDSAISNLSSQIAALSKQVVSSATYTQFTNESTAATVPWANNIQALESKIKSHADELLATRFRYYTTTKSGPVLRLTLFRPGRRERRAATGVRQQLVRAGAEPDPGQPSRPDQGHNPPVQSLPGPEQAVFPRSRLHHNAEPVRLLGARF